MIQNYYYSYKDILKAPRIAIGPQRIIIASLGIGVAHMVYLLFTYAALIVSGSEAQQVFATYGLFPVVERAALSAMGAALFWSGFFFTALTILLTNIAVSRAAYMYLRDNYFYTSKQAILFALNRTKSILAVNLTFLFLLFPFIAGAFIMALVGRIPWFGEILNALATLPYIFSGMVFVFITICFLISIFLAPAIMASSEEDGFGTAVQCMHLTWGQPWRLASYGFLTFVLFMIGMVGFTFVIKIGLIIYSIFFMPLMDSLAPIFNNALYMVEVSIGGLDSFIRDIIGGDVARLIYLKKHYAPMEITLSQSIASSIVYIFFMVAAYMVVGYGQAIINSGLTMSYIVFELKLTTKNLLRRNDSEIIDHKNESDDLPTVFTKNLSEGV